MLNPAQTNAQACSQSVLLLVPAIVRHPVFLCTALTDSISNDSVCSVQTMLFFQCTPCMATYHETNSSHHAHFWPIDWSKFHLDHAGLTWPSTVCHPSRADGDGCDGCATPPGPGERSPAASWPPPADLLLRDGARRTASPRPTGLTLLCPLSSAVMSWYWAHSPDLDDPFL